MSAVAFIEMRRMVSMKPQEYDWEKDEQMVPETTCDLTTPHFMPSRARSTIQRYLLSAVV